MTWLTDEEITNALRRKNIKKGKSLIKEIINTQTGVDGLNRLQLFLLKTSAPDTHALIDTSDKEKAKRISCILASQSKEAIQLLTNFNITINGTDEISFLQWYILFSPTDEETVKRISSILSCGAKEIIKAIFTDPHLKIETLPLLPWYILSAASVVERNKRIQSILASHIPDIINILIDTKYRIEGHLFLHYYLVKFQSNKELSARIKHILSSHAPNAIKKLITPELNINGDLLLYWYILSSAASPEEMAKRFIYVLKCKITEVSNLLINSITINGQPIITWYILSATTDEERENRIEILEQTNYPGIRDHINKAFESHDELLTLSLSSQDDLSILLGIKRPLEYLPTPEEPSTTRQRGWCDFFPTPPIEPINTISTREPAAMIPSAYMPPSKR